MSQFAPSVAPGAEPLGLPPEADDDPWGSAAQQAAGAAALAAAVGRPEAQLPGSLRWQAATRLAEQGAAQAAPRAVLAAAQRLCEAHWRRPVVGDFVTRRLFGRALFSAWKAIDCLRLGRSPTDVSEGFVRASGAVGEAALQTRDLFWQRFRPLAPAPGQARRGGKVVLVVPGLGETGRSYYGAVAQLNARGHDVFLMDQQWAGQSRRTDGHATPGALDRGFGAARDVGRMAEYIGRLLGEQGARQLVLLGHGAGGGAIFMLLVAHAAGLLDVALPPQLSAVLQQPYLAPAPHGAHRLLTFVGRLPWGRGLSALPWLGGRGGAAQARAEATARLRDSVRMHLGALGPLQHDLRLSWALLHQGARPRARLAVVHSADDRWADPGASHRLRRADAMGPNAAVRIEWGRDANGPGAGMESTLWGLHKLEGGGPAPELGA